ncbi:MAG TPA: FUSC family protein, partial [Verrucomicrobiota bacterium]|nr:FUSC family protein [Verrucomicrobiota bacterium]
HPLYAMIAAVLVTDLSPAKTRKLGIPRLAGTVLGATLDATIGSLLPGGTWFLGLGIFGGMYLTHVMGLEEAVKLAGYVCGIVLLDHASKPWSCAVWRIVETLLGIGLAVSVSFVPKLLSPDTSEQSCA